MNFAVKSSEEIDMAELKGSRTEQCLKEAFAIESQVQLRYMYFANKADLEGKSDVATSLLPSKSALLAKYM